MNDRIIYQSETQWVSLCKISVFCNSKGGSGHFPVGLRLPSGLSNGSDVPGIFATIHPWPQLTKTYAYRQKDVS